MCVRGYQKKVIFIKNAGSNFFEEAYFVLKDDEKNRIFSHATMVSEANKIIEENFGIKKRRFKFLKLPVLFSFLLGCALSLFLSFVVF